MKKRILTFLMMGILTAGVLGGCGGDAEPVSEAEASRPAPEMTLEERPAGDFWSVDPDTPLSEIEPEYLYAIGQPLQSGETEAETVGELLDYWAGLPADDPLVSPRYSDAASRTRTIEHTYPVLGGVGETLEKGENSVTLSQVVSDGYVTRLTFNYPADTDFPEGNGLRFTGPDDRMVPEGGLSYWVGPLYADSEGQTDVLVRSALPVEQISDHADLPFAFDVDLSLAGCMTEVKTAGLPPVDNTEPGFEPVYIQVSPLSVAVTFAVIGEIPEGAAVEEPVVLLADGQEAADYTPAQWSITDAGYDFIPAEVPLAAGEYDYRRLFTLLVTGQADEELIPALEDIDAIEFEGETYPLQ